MTGKTYAVTFLKPQENTLRISIQDVEENIPVVISKEEVGAYHFIDDGDEEAREHYLYAYFVHTPHRNYGLIFYYGEVIVLPRGAIVKIGNKYAYLLRPVEVKRYTGKGLPYPFFEVETVGNTILSFPGLILDSVKHPGMEEHRKERLAYLEEQMKARGF